MKSTLRRWDRTRFESRSRLSRIAGKLRKLCSDEQQEITHASEEISRVSELEVPGL